MDRKNLQLTKAQENILDKKKIYTVEGFLRKPPLHYYDFSEFYRLDKNDFATKMRLEEHTPFAITGKILSANMDVMANSYAKIFKVKVKDDLSGQILHINIIGAEQYKYRILQDHPKNPFYTHLEISEEDNTYLVPGYETRKVWKKIEILNSIDDLSKVPLALLGALNTSGYDDCSKISEERLMQMFSPSAVQCVKKQFPNDHYAFKTALRWHARGLRLDLSIYKMMLSMIHLETLLSEGMPVIVGGAINYSDMYHCYSVMNPVVLSSNKEKYQTFYTQYSQMSGFTQDTYEEAVNHALSLISNEPDFMPDVVKTEMGLPSFYDAFYQFHHPLSFRDITYAKRRMMFEDLLYFALKIESNKPSENVVQAEPMPKDDLMKQYISSLPYDLTNGQRQAIEEISEKMSSGKTVHSLIQGDVGTGKTCVAFSVMLKAVSNGFQAALAVPYTTLAGQHFRDLQQITEDLKDVFDLHVVLLTSEMKASEKKKALKQIASGEANIIVGTHSIFTEKVVYKNLGVIIQDEEHKFGVVHRKEFEEKGMHGCHKITMSATPIPKSLAETIYGSGMNIITITDKPANRLTIKTGVSDNNENCAKFILTEIAKHHQAYIVCPSIEKGQNDKDIPSIEEYEKIYRPIFEANHVSMAVLTGKMKQAEKDAIMNDFKDGKIDILMATTVIEVGINVPNATVMLIVGADRFGFSTLHQLRGRVGRGKDQSYCILESQDPNNKLAFMKETSDGFKIAEKDLELRGPGTLFGERQSGDNYFVDLMLSYPKLFQKAKEYAVNILKNEEETGLHYINTYEALYLSEEER